MSALLSLLFTLVVLWTLTWVLVFGALGGYLAHLRGWSRFGGAALSALLGPVGWLIVWLRTRDAGTVALSDWQDSRRGAAR